MRAEEDVTKARLQVSAAAGAAVFATDFYSDQLKRGETDAPSLPFKDQEVAKERQIARCP